jgi:hypothetical protein
VSGHSEIMTEVRPKKKKSLCTWASALSKTKGDGEAGWRTGLIFFSILPWLPLNGMWFGNPREQLACSYAVLSVGPGEGTNTSV